MGAEATLKMLLLGEDRSASKVLRGVGAEAEKQSSTLGKFGKAVAVSLIAAGAAAIEFGKKSVDAFKDAAGESLTLSRATGENVKDASRLRFAAEETGVSFESLSKSTRTFAKNLGAATGDAKKAAAMTKELGFAFRDAHGHVLPMTTLLPKLADKFKDMPNGPEKTALAMKLFGKAGTDMIKMLNKGSEGLHELAKESDKTGNTISNTRAYQDQIKAQREFHAALNGLMITLGSALMPIFTKVSEFLVQHVAPAFAKATTFIREHKKLIADLTPVIAGLVIGISGLMIVQKVTSMFSAFNAIIAANPVMAIVVAIVALVAALVIAYKKVAWFHDLVNSAFNGIRDVFNTVVNFISDHWRLLLSILTGPIGATVIFIVGHWRQISSGFGDAIGWIRNTWNDLMGFFGGTVSSVGAVFARIGATITGIFKGVWDGVIASFRWIWNRIADVINGGISMANSVGGIVGVHLSSVPYLANGGIVLPRAGGTIARIGEAGQAEAVIPLNRLGSMVGGGSGTTVVNNFNIATLPGGEQAVANEIKRLLSQKARLSGNPTAMALFQGAW